MPELIKNEVLFLGRVSEKKCYWKDIGIWANGKVKARHCLNKSKYKFRIGNVADAIGHSRVFKK